MTGKWPDDFPKNCPPDESIHSEDCFYRLVDSIPPTSDDFLRSRDEPAHKDKDLSGDTLVCSYGTSIFTDQKDAFKTRKKYKRAMSKKRVAKGFIDQSLGKVKQTFTPSHHTAWFYDGSQPELVFLTEEKE